MVRDLLDSVSAHLRDRISNPLGGALLVSFLAWNNRALFVLFSDEPIYWRLAYLEVVLYPGVASKLANLVLIPSIMAAAYIFAYPIVSRRIYKYVLKARMSLRNIKNDVEGARLLTEDQGARIRKRSYEREAEFRKKESDWQERIDAAEAQIQMARNEVAERDKKIDELKSSLALLKADFANQINGVVASAELRGRLNAHADEVRKKHIESALLENDFILHFNPKNGGEKLVSFIEGGDIGLGKNKNENSWRVESGRLEFLDGNGDVYSRFNYEGDGRFSMDYFSGQPAIVGQYLEVSSGEGDSSG